MERVFERDKVSGRKKLKYNEQAMNNKLITCNFNRINNMQFYSCQALTSQ